MPTTKKLLLRYEEQAGAPLYLASKFRTYPELLTHEKFQVHVRRATRKVASPVASVDANGRENSVGLFSEADLTPPIYKENITLPSRELWNQQYGLTVSDQQKYSIIAQRAIEMAVGVVADTIRRGIELQASQALATGAIALVDETGVTRFAYNFAPKTSHMITVGTTWASSTNKVQDLANAQEVVRVDGKRRVTDVLFGRRSWNDWLNDSQVQTLLNNRRIDIGNIATPSSLPEDASFHGAFTLDNNVIRMFTYSASYDHPQTGTDTKYVNDDHVILMPDNPDFDLVFGEIPRFDGEIPGGVPTFRRREVLPGKGIGFDAIAWMSNDRTSVTVQIGVRAMVVPKAIDTYARVQTR